MAIGSPREVNLDIEIRAHTAQNILNPSFDTFDRAQKRIQALMEKDSYPRFLESDLYKNLLGSYAGPYPTSCASAASSSSSSTTSSASQSNILSKSNLVSISNESITHPKTNSTTVMNSLSNFSKSININENTKQNNTISNSFDSSSSTASNN